MSRDHNAFIYASNLCTAAKHIEHALLVAMHFLEIEGCESADSLISALGVKSEHSVIIRGGPRARSIEASIQPLEKCSLKRQR